jgi:hypothetical protein
LGTTDKSAVYGYPDDGTLAAALRLVRLRSLESPDAACGVNEAHVQVALTLVRVARSSQSEVILCWPSQPDGVVSIHALASLGLVSMAPTQTPTGLRVLYFPWNIRAGEAAKRALVDREWLVEVHRGGMNRQHQSRPSAGGDKIFTLHRLMVRLQDLDGEVFHKGKRRILGEYLHPTLAETCALGVLDQDALSRPLLWRTRKHTAIKKLSFDGVDAHPKASYAVLGVRGPAENVKAVISAAKSPIDAILINALQRRCEALGDSWPKQVVEMLNATRALFGKAIPVLTVTDDTWIQHVFAKEILPTHRSTSDAPVASTGVSAVLMEPARIYEVREPFVADGAQDIHFHAPSGAPTSIEDIYRQLIKDAYDLNERDVMDLFVQSRSGFRQFVSLPASLSEWKQFLFEESGLSNDDAADAVDDLDARRSLREALTEHSECLSVQANTELIARLVQEVSAYVDRHAAVRTATAEVFAQLLKSKLHLGERTAVVLCDDRVREFVEHLLASLVERDTNTEQPSTLLLMSFPQFRDIAEARLAKPDGVASAVILGLGRRRLMQLMGARWLPPEITVIADVGVVRAVAADAAQIERRIGLEPLGDRLSRLSLAAMECVQRCASELPSLEWNQPPPDLEASLVGGLVDLRGVGAKSDATDVQLRMDNGAIVIARPRSTIVRFDPDAPVDRFSEGVAEDLRAGDLICVLNRDFFDGVRELLGSGAAAAHEIRAYHEFVAKQVSAMPGASYTEKAARIVAQMAKRGRVIPEESRVVDWIRADRWLKDDDSTVRPHAPWRFEDFEAFLLTLGAPQLLIPRFWRLGVMMTRSARLSAASQFNETCINILTRTEDMIDQYRERSADFLKVRAQAEGTVAAVVEVRGGRNSVNEADKGAR